MLDEALVAISVGDAQRLETPGKSMCSLLASCDRAVDLQRAEEWARLVEAAPEGGVPMVLAEHCRMVRSGLLAATGRWDEAEAALEALLAGMAASAPHRIESMARLADLRIQRGRLTDAAALIEPFEDAVAMRAPLARLHLARGEVASAVAVVDQGLRELVADRLRGAALLDVAVQAELARDDVAGAEGYARRLVELADGADAPSLRADADGALGRVARARGDLDSAVSLLTSAFRGFEASSRPLHAGAARLELADALAASGDAAAAVVEARGALACFERLGASPMVDRALQRLRDLGVRARSRSDGASALAGLTVREAEVLALVQQGLSNGEIGARLFISAKTVEHHVGRLLAKLGARTRAEAAALAAQLAGPGPDGGRD
jgi:DNA-binding CsgD family transcriptional regulator